MTTLQEAARKALEALKTCSYGDYSAKHVVDPSFDGDAVEAAIESLKAALAQQATLVPQEWTNLLAYALQDDMHNRLTPRVVDIAYTAFTLAKRPNSEDGGASDWFNDTKPKVTELIAKLRKDLIEEFAAAPAPQAQQMEPTDDQLVKGVKAMRLFVTKNSVADFKLGYMAALAAAPAPQAQDGTFINEGTKSAPKPGFHDCTFDAAPQAQPICKLFGTLPVYDTPAPQPAHQGERAELIRRLLAIANTEANEVADALNEAADMLQSAQPVAQPAQGVGRTNPGDETGGAVERFGWQTFLGKSPEIIPATNGSFVWYSDYLKLWQSAQPVAQQDHIPDAGEMVLSDDEILTIAHRKATRYTHAVAPGQVTYGFTVAHLLDFANSIREVK